MVVGGLGTVEVGLGIEMAKRKSGEPSDRIRKPYQITKKTPAPETPDLSATSCPSDNALPPPQYEE